MIYMFTLKYQISTEYSMLKSLTLQNTIFIETTINQTNIVLIELENTNYNLTFTKELDRQKVLITR